MQVKEIMTYGVETIDTDDTLLDAAKTLNVGALPVRSGDELIGMITDRDITIWGIAEGKEPKSTSINEVMTPELYRCCEDDSLEDAVKIMEDKAIRRLLVVNSQNEPSGMLSVADVSVKSKNEHLVWEVIEHISEPACPNR